MPPGGGGGTGQGQPSAVTVGVVFTWLPAVVLSEPTTGSKISKVQKAKTAKIAFFFM
jgi:hypothetical protein